ncbi:MAG: glycosyltransferase family 4 protein [Nitrospira sp.]|nr:glycosyltransferase family 4 protein [Nitrospira sp.]
MKILLVSDYSVPRGGNEVVTLSLRDGLRARGHDVRLFASRAYADEAAEPAEYGCFGTATPLRAALWCGNPSAFLGLRHALADFQPDVVHVRLFLSQLSPLILPLLREVPAVYHDGWYRTVCPIGSRVLPDGKGCHEPAGSICYRAGCVPALAWPLLMTQLHLWRCWRDVFDVVVANSRSVAEWLEVSGIPRVEVIPNGIKAREPRPPLSGPPIIAFAGRLAYEKGVDTLLDAYKLVIKQRPDTQLLIAGEGPESGRLRRIAEQLDAKIEFLGHQPREIIEHRFNAAWVQVVPSRGSEAFGNAAAEAMMRGTALVASATGGFTEYVRHEETGLLVAPGDHAALGRLLLKVLGDREYAESLGLAGRRYALMAFDQGQFLDRFIAIYEGLTKARSVSV